VPHSLRPVPPKSIFGAQARVLEHLRSAGLLPGIARELRKHVAILAREIAELE
jgi:hypothetical protein